MDTLTAIQERRSIRAYDPNHKMRDEEINKLLSMAILAPTAFNVQNWRFVVVRDPETRKKIRAEAWDQPQVTDASVMILLVGDVNAWKTKPERYCRNLPEDIQKTLLSALEHYFTQENIDRDEAVRSCSLAAQTIMLAAKAMGYDTCAMTGFDFDVVSKLINLPKDHVLVMGVVVGKAKEKALTRGGQLPLEEVVVQERF